MLSLYSCLSSAVQHGHGITEMEDRHFRVVMHIFLERKLIIEQNEDEKIQMKG